MTIEWLNGPHANFILLSYLIAAVVVLVTVFAPVLRLRQLRIQLQLKRNFEENETP